MSGGFKSDIPPAINRTAKNYIRGMQKGRIRWDKLYGTRAKEVMHKTANKMAMGEMQKMPPTYNEIFGEANKSGDSSLRDWFSKSRSSDGTPGWVQLGGKYAGKPCAKQPGQTTKPKCGSSKMKRDLNKDEEETAFRRKNAEDPNPDRKGKAKNVATEEFHLEEGMSLKDFKANRRKLKRKEVSTDAKKRGHVGKEWYNSGRTYSPDEAKRGRAKMDDEERSTRKRSAIDPDAEDSDYSADKTKNPKKLRKQKAMGESTINEEDYDRMKDRRMERGGVDGNTNYRKPPAKKLSNKELGIRDFTPAEKEKRAKEMSAHLKKMGK